MSRPAAENNSPSLAQRAPAAIIAPPAPYEGGRPIRAHRHRAAALALLCTVLAVAPAAAEGGVRVVLTPARPLDQAGMHQAAAVLKDRVARLGLRAGLVTDADRITLTAPDETDLAPFGLALAQRGVLGLWWAQAFTGVAPVGVHDGEVLSWNADWDKPDGQYIGLALPAAPATGHPHFSHVTESTPPNHTVPQLTLQLDAETIQAVAAGRAAAPPGARLVLTLDGDVLAASPAGAGPDQMVIPSHEVGFYARSLEAIFQSGPLPLRLSVTDMTVLGDPPGSDVILGNPPQPVTLTLAPDHPAAPDALGRARDALQDDLSHLALWNAAVAIAPGDLLTVSLGAREDAPAVQALLTAAPLPEWHWGRFAPTSTPQPAGAPPIRASLVKDLGLGVTLRLEDAPALLSGDVTGAEIVRLTQLDDTDVTTLALALRPSAARLLHDQLLQRGGEQIFALLGDKPIGPFTPRVTVEGRLVLHSPFFMAELWPVAAATLQQDLPLALHAVDQPPR